MSTLNLEVGKKYMNRNGVLIKIVRRRPFYSAEYMDNYGNSYYTGGNYLFIEECFRDLISEVKTQQDKPKRISQNKFDKKFQKVREAWGMADSTNVLNLNEFVDDLRNELFWNEENE